MDAPRITDWMSAIGTVVAALVAAPAAVYAALYTKRAAEEAAKAAAAAVDQVKELRAPRMPKAVLKIRVTDLFDAEHEVKYGYGGHQFRSGPSVVLDVWNVSEPTIMVMRVTVRVSDAPQERVSPQRPQLLVESGKVLSFNVGHRILSQVAARESKDLSDVPDGATAETQFSVDFFSVDGEQSIQVNHKFRFSVSEKELLTWSEDDLLRDARDGPVANPSTTPEPAE
jgi:hypothetical protein